MSSADLPTLKLKLLGAAALLGLNMAACSGGDSVGSTKPFAVAAAAAGGNVIGEISGSVGGKNGTWHTLKISEAGQSHATASYSSPMSAMTDYTLQGHTNGLLQIENSLSLQITMMNGRLAEAGVKYFPESSTLPFYSDHEGSVIVSVDKLESGEESDVIAGTATGTLYKVASLTGEPDADDRLSIDVTFESTVYAE